MNLFKSKMPKKLVIAGREVAVKMQSDLAATTGLLGEAKYQPPTIAIDSNVPDSMLLEVLLHEVLHHLDYAHGEIYGFNNEEDGEKICRALGIALSSVVMQL